jgi:8-oxo-dGTP diphosphatase
MRRAARAIIIHNQSILLMKRNKFGNLYYALVGGGIEMGESADHAVLREVKEETTVTGANPRLVFIEQTNEMYGPQYIFLVDYQDGEAKLDPNSTEAAIHRMGKNLYEPIWVPVSKFASLPFLSSVLQKEILAGLREGFPKEPKTFQSEAEISHTRTTKGEK